MPNRSVDINLRGGSNPGITITQRPQLQVPSNIQMPQVITDHPKKIAGGVLLMLLGLGVAGHYDAKRREREARDAALKAFGSLSPQRDGRDDGDLRG